MSSRTARQRRSSAAGEQAVISSVAAACHRMDGVGAPRDRTFFRAAMTRTLEVRTSAGLVGRPRLRGWHHFCVVPLAIVGAVIWRYIIRPADHAPAVVSSARAPRRGPPARPGGRRPSRALPATPGSAAAPGAVPARRGVTRSKSPSNVTACSVHRRLAMIPAVDIGCSERSHERSHRPVPRRRRSPADARGPCRTAQTLYRLRPAFPQVATGEYTRTG